MSTISVKQGEAKWVTLEVTTTSGTAVDLSGGTLFMGVKRTKTDSAYAFTHGHSSFTYSLATGVVSVFLTTTNTIQFQGDLVGELKIIYATSPTEIEKTSDFTITVTEAVTKY